MGIDAGFDLFPPLSTIEDLQKWERFMKFLSELIEDGEMREKFDWMKTALVSKNQICFAVGEHPFLPMNGFFFRSFTSKINSKGDVLGCIGFVCALAKKFFPKRIYYWSELFDVVDMKYSWTDIYGAAEKNQIFDTVQNNINELMAYRGAFSNDLLQKSFDVLIHCEEFRILIGDQGLLVSLEYLHNICPVNVIAQIPLEIKNIIEKISLSKYPFGSPLSAMMVIPIANKLMQILNLTHFVSSDCKNLLSKLRQEKEVSNISLFVDTIYVVSKQPECLLELEKNSWEIIIVQLLHDWIHRKIKSHGGFGPGNQNFFPLNLLECISIATTKKESVQKIMKMKFDFVDLIGTTMILFISKMPLMIYQVNCFKEIPLFIMECLVILKHCMTHSRPNIITIKYNLEMLLKAHEADRSIFMHYDTSKKRRNAKRIKSVTKEIGLLTELKDKNNNFINSPSLQTELRGQTLNNISDKGQHAVIKLVNGKKFQLLTIPSLDNDSSFEWNLEKIKKHKGEIIEDFRISKNNYTVSDKSIAVANSRSGQYTPDIPKREITVEEFELKFGKEWIPISCIEYVLDDEDASYSYESYTKVGYANMFLFQGYNANNRYHDDDDNDEHDPLEILPKISELMKEIKSRQEDQLLVCGCCQKKSENNIKLQLCSQCRSVAYCNRDCQKSDWPSHKKYCNQKQVK